VRFVHLVQRHFDEFDPAVPEVCAVEVGCSAVCSTRIASEKSVGHSGVSDAVGSEHDTRTLGLVSALAEEAEDVVCASGVGEALELDARALAH
jgi:hypothetical protein